VQNASVNNYNVLLSTIDYVSGNANACDLGATYKVRVAVNATPPNPSFEIGDNARLHIRFPQSYDIQNTDITINRSAFPQATVNWVNPTIESRNVVGNETEIVMVVPKGMKDTHYFDVHLKIKQKANALVDCTVERSLKVLTTDKVTNIPCATLTPPTCPALIVSTSPERTAVIRNDRSELSFADVQVTAVPQANKENLTIQYKLANAATASAYNGQLVVSLYNDLNNNGLVDSGEVLTTHTSTQSLASGATSAVQSFTFLADPSQVCRLRLAIRNEDNNCLCGNKELALPTPVISGNLVSDATTCESDPVTFVYNGAAATYNSYTWSPANYLSASNVSTPTFLYNGAKLTAPLMLTYTLTVRRTNGCESTQQVKVTVNPSPSITTEPVAPTTPYCMGVAATPLTVTATANGLGTLTYEWYENVTHSYTGGTQVGTNSASYTPLTTTIGTKYYYVKVKSSSCGEVNSDIIEVITNATPATPTVAQVAAAGCGTLSTAKVSNHTSYPAGTAFTITTAADAAVAGASVAADGTINGITAAGTYKVKATRGTCTSEANFTIDAALPVPVAPIVTLTPASCTSLTVAKISNYVSGQTYWNGTTQLTVNATTHEITGLGVGTYTITAKNTGCESVASSSFEIKAKQAATTTTNPVGAIYAKDAIAVPLTVTATGEGVLSYQWFEATSPTALGTAVGSNSPSYTPSTSTIGSKFYYVEVTGSCGTVRSAVAEIKVTPTIKANDDPDTTVGGGGIVDILSNDRLNGNPVTPTDVAITIPNDGGLTGLTVDNATGKLKVPTNATPGTYEVTYKICAVGGTTTCDTAKVKITVTGTPTTIQANDDGVWEVGTQGDFLTPSVLDNDQIGTRIGLTASDVLIEKTQGQPTPDSHLVMNADGRITVKSGIAIGTYIYYYTIIDKTNNQTSRAKAIIKVVNFVAQQDEYRMVNTKSIPQSTPSVITNDEMDGKKPPVIGTDVTLTPGVASHPNLHMNPDGTITISPNTPDGTYTYEYTICRISNPSDCKRAKAIIHLHPSVVANDDDYSAQPLNVIRHSAVVGNVLDNDTLGGAAITDPTKVIITLLDNGGLSGVSIGSNGAITVPQGAPSGTYRVRYNLCISDLTMVCDDAVITLEVSKEGAIEIYNGVSSNGDGHNDGFSIKGIEDYPKNRLKIFNRWGVLVYEKEGYTNSEPFRGYSNGRSTIERGKKLPQGTYYYILEYENSHNQTQTKSGWLYLKTE